VGAVVGCSRKLSYRQPFVFYALIHRNRTIINDAVGVNDTAQITLIELYGHDMRKKNNPRSRIALFIQVSDRIKDINEIFFVEMSRLIHAALLGLIKVSSYYY